MAAQGMTDAAMGLALGISGQRVYNLRKRHGIPSGFRHGEQSREADAPAPPILEPELVYQENGITVKRYPARYAETSSWGKVVR